MKYLGFDFEEPQIPILCAIRNKKSLFVYNLAKRPFIDKDFKTN